MDAASQTPGPMFLGKYMHRVTGLVHDLPGEGELVTTPEIIPMPCFGLEMECGLWPQQEFYNTFTAIK
ncbi:MAG TPA: hypothetical protein VGY56_10625 [Verrucomicrobiae bacterium]|nr:hypothetical protein [Verrucomicrobiae bacterium]